MLTVVRRIHLPKDEKWLLDIAKFLFFNGYFHSIKNVNKSEVISMFSFMHLNFF